MSEEAASSSSSSSSLYSTTPGPVVDGILFLCVCVFTLFIGMYQGCAQSHGLRIRKSLSEDRQSSSGNASSLSKEASVGSISIPIIVSYASMGVILGLPAATYYNGTGTVLAGLLPAVLGALFTVVFFFLPVFYSSQAPAKDLLSYVHLRFQSTALTAAIRIIVVLAWSVFTGVILYGLSSLLRHMSSFEPATAVILVIIAATVYVALEGKGHMVWSDLVLSVLLLIALLILLILGLVTTSDVMEKNGARDLLRGDESTVSVFSGQFFLWLCVFLAFYTAEPSSGPRAESLGTSSSSPRSIRAPNLLLLFFLQLPVLAFIVGLVILIGAIAAANYPTKTPRCGDPVTKSGSPDADDALSWLQWQPDQPTLTLVTEKIGFSLGLYGFPGFFFSCLSLQSLSFTSSGFNYIADNIWQRWFEETEDDLLGEQPINGHSTSGQQHSGQRRHVSKGASHRNLSRILSTRCFSAGGTFLSGLLAFAFQGKTVFEAAIASTGILAGIIVAVVTLGLFVPYANGRGTFLGVVIALILGHWISISGGFISFPPQENHLVARRVQSSEFAFVVKSELWNCNDEIAQSHGNRNASQRYDSPQSPTAITDPKEKNSHPGFLIPQRPEHGKSQENLLPHSPVSQGQILDPPGRRVIALALSSSGLSQQPSSPHLKNSMTTGLGHNSQNFTGTTGTMMSGNSGGGNRPPMILGNPHPAIRNNKDTTRFPKEKGPTTTTTTTTRRREQKNFFASISIHLYSLIGFGLTIVLSLLLSFRPLECVSMSSSSGQASNGVTAAVTSTNAANQLLASSALDPRLLHPAARRLCCKCCRQRIAVKPEEAIKFSMEKRRSQMAISIEDTNGMHTYRQGSLISRNSQQQQQLVTAVDGGSHNGSDHPLSRRCSRHSHVSKRSSLASSGHGPGGVTTTTTAEVMVPPGSPMPSSVACADIERRLSQLSDTEVDQVVTVAIEEASRRNSNASGTASYHGHTHSHRRLSPQVSLNVPHPGTSLSTSGSLLAPPTSAESMAQRRFSEVTAAIERHNSRRQAKRSQSVMYRQKRRASRRNSEVRHSPTDFDPYRPGQLQVPSVVTTGAGQI